LYTSYGFLTLKDQQSVIPLDCTNIYSHFPFVLMQIQHLRKYIFFLNLAVNNIFIDFLQPIANHIQSTLYVRHRQSPGWHLEMQRNKNETEVCLCQSWPFSHLHSTEGRISQKITGTRRKCVKRSEKYGPTVKRIQNPCSMLRIPESDKVQYHKSFQLL
jgi:hypothetical protein